MLLTKTDLELSQRPVQYIEIFRMLCGGSVPVRREALGTDFSAIRVCGIDGDSDIVRVSGERGSEFGYAISEGTRYRLYAAFQETWKRIASNCPKWERRYLNALREEAAQGQAQGQAGGRQRKAQVGEDWIFEDLGLRFYIQTIDEGGADGKVHPWLRCEWMGYRFLPDLEKSAEDDLSVLEKIRSAIVFDAENAAHPHFHFDSIPLSLAATREINARWPAQSPANPFTEIISGDFNPFEDNVIQSRQVDLQHLHLPTVASWRSVPFTKDAFKGDFQRMGAPLAHQVYPSSIEEIDNWASWSLHYFKDQFEKYVAERPNGYSV